MARAESAHASPRSQSIKGLAQSIANPAYRRLLTAEPALRRAVPLLIIAFLATVGIGAIVQAYERHRDAISSGLEEIETVADIVVDRFDRPFATPVGRPSEQLADALPVRASVPERYVVLIDPSVAVRAAVPPLSPPIAEALLDIVREAQSAATRPRGGGAEIILEDVSVLATVRPLKGSSDRLVVIEPRAAALAAWHTDTMLTITLFATTGFVLLILGFAFHWQSLRARDC